MKAKKGIRKQVDRTRSQIVIIFEKDDDNSNKSMMQMITNIAYTEKAILTFYQLENEIIFILYSNHLEKLEELF